MSSVHCVREGLHKHTIMRTQVLVLVGLFDSRAEGPGDVVISFGQTIPSLVA